MLDVEKFITGLHEYMAREFVIPVAARLKALEERASVPGPQGEKGEPGLNGKDGAPGERGEKGEAGTPGERGESGPQGLQGEKGETGLNGKDGALGERGEKGDAGEPGPQGLQGENGEPGLNGKDGAPGERGEKGESGPQGLQGEKGEAGTPGKDGRDGIDGKSVTIEEVRQMLEGEVSKWALDFERRAQDILQKAIDRIPVPKDGRDGFDGKDGAPGEKGRDGHDGTDGLGFEDIEVLPEGERGIVVRVTNGSKTKEFPFRFPVVIDRGVYKMDGTYEKGDGVTYAGSFWISQKDAPETKPGAGADWRLAVKKGRDGKDLAIRENSL